MDETETVVPDGAVVKVGRARRPLRLLSLLILAVLVASSVAGYFVIRSVVDDEQDRLLRARGEEAGLVIQSLFQPVVATLGQLASTDIAEPGTHPEFAKVARADLGIVEAIGAMTNSSGGVFRSVMSVGAGLPADTVAATDRAALAARALASKGPVEAVVDTSRGPRLSLALQSGSGLVVYEDLAFDPTTPVDLGKSGPFSDLDGAVYAAGRADPAALVVTTTHLPLRGETRSQTITVGQQHWLLVIESRGPLVGSLASKAPWAIFVGGLLAAALATLLVETLARRRSYALSLVDQRTAALRQAEANERQARQAAEGANRAKSEFLSRMSHELRTPLNAIIGFGQLLELDHLERDQQESVSQILKGGRHLLELINEVLDISRIETGNLSLSPEPVSVAHAIADAVVLMRPLAQQRRIDLRIPPEAHDGPELHVMADRQRLNQVLLNLISNAIKYNRQQGEVTVSVERAPGQRCRIVVSDTGLGIPADKLDRLFVPFDRLGAESSGVEGTGVGLALSRRLAEAMAGTLEAASQHGQGSRFWIELPITEGPLERYERLNGTDVHPEHDDSDRSVVRHKVLYIEDNLSNLRLIERVLGQLDGVELVPAMQGRLGLTLAKEHQPDVILLDIHLPDISGEQVLEELRKDPATANIPVVILSADATPHQIQRLQAAGAAAYLTKPIEIRQLLDVLAGQFIPAPAT